ncbi:MAG: hypothetical protein KOO61_02790 [Spirochaetales bacterium]|nr:hypothetical protein [Spirochaetales bacterium]
MANTNTSQMKTVGDDVQVLTTATSLMEKVGLGADPTDFGLPDLLEDGIDQNEQDRRLLEVVTRHLFIYKDGRKLPIIVIPPMLEFLSDLFFERVQQAILWKPRGGGGSLAAAVLIWLMMVYRNKSFIDMAGSGEQAKRVYEYTTQFWFCIPGLAEAVLLKDPLQSLTALKNGVTLSCVPASEKAARGKHTPGFVADESCQEDPRIGRVLQAAIQGVLSEPNFTIVLLSTFHVPFGFFQEAWDLAEERGFKRYRWDVYDCMARCDVGLDSATDSDPQAISYCQSECPLTEVIPDYNANGEHVGEHIDGCCGRARITCGHLSRDNIIKAKLLNRGTDIWAVEHECKRPTASGMIYNPEKVQEAVVPVTEIVRPAGTVRRAVGIDWGRFAVAVLAERADDHIAITEGRIFDSRPISDLVQYLVELRSRVGDFVVYADAENAYGNLDCRNAGFETVPVSFNRFKDEGIENLARYFEHGKIKIADEGALQTVVRQLLRYHRDESGRIVKKDDHGPDALLCAMLPFPFIDEFDAAISQLLAGTDRERLKITSSLLDACVRDYPREVKEGERCSMGVSVSPNGHYVVISLVPSRELTKDEQVRKAVYIGKVRQWQELDALIDQYGVKTCLISTQPEPHLVQEWCSTERTAAVFQVRYVNGTSLEPAWDDEKHVIKVDRTFALNSAFEEIASQTWWIPASAPKIERGEFYAQLKAPTRVRDIASGELKYSWIETGPLDNFHHAHVFDFLAASRALNEVEAASASCDDYDDGLLADYSTPLWSERRKHRW